MSKKVYKFVGRIRFSSNLLTEWGKLAEEFSCMGINISVVMAVFIIDIE